MKTHSLYPLMFRPQYRDYLWGGDLIATRYNRANTPRPCAESWELCGLPGHESVVANGPFEGVGLGHLTQTFGRDLVGAKAPDPERFPLLVKLLDVHSRLSVQVHPDAKAAASLGGEPKHEMWYLLDAAPNATLWAGLRPDADLANLAEPDLVAHRTHTGDVFDVPAGLVHCIGPGNLLYEVQQPSDTTLRVHDWGRGRPTQPEAARVAIHPGLRATCQPQPAAKRDLCPRLSTPDFSFATLSLTHGRTLHTTEQSLMVLFCAEGKTTLEHDGPHPLTLLPGDSVLIPARQTVFLHPFAPTKLLVTTL